MEPMEQLVPGCFVLGSRYFPLFWLDTDPPVLVEGGVSAVIPRVREQMASLYLEPPASVVLLHEHSDHVMGIPPLKESWPSLEVFAAPEAVSLLSKPKVIDAYRKTDTFFTSTLVMEGEGQAAQEAPFPPVTLLDEDSLPDEVTFIPTPGHSPGSCVLFWEERGLLFVSDAVGYNSSRGIHCPLFFHSLELYLDSIALIEAMEPSVMVLGHLQYYRDEVSEVLRTSREEALRLQELVKTKGKEIEPRIFQNIYQEELARFYPRDLIRECARLLVARSLEV